MVRGRGIRGRGLLNLLVDGQILQGRHEVICQSDRVGRVLLDRLPAYRRTARRADEKVLVRLRHWQVLFAVGRLLEQMLGSMRAREHTNNGSWNF